MINPEISQKMILEYCHNHSEQNSSAIIELEKYTWECIHIIWKIQVFRIVQKNLEANSNWKWIYKYGASIVEKIIKIRDNLL